MMRTAATILASLLIGIAAPAAGAADPAGALPVPAFRFDVDWMKMPPRLALGDITAVAVDRRDHVWVLHRPRSVKGVPPGEIAPPVVEFDPQGRYLRGFGGPGEGYEWPAVEHSLAVAANGDVWIGGSLVQAEHGDDMLIVLDRNGRFVRQLGKRGASGGNADDRNFKAPADIYVDDAGREVYVADGYGNQRVVVLSRDGQFRRKWGANGNPPPAAPVPGTPAAPLSGSAFNGVHGVERSRDGLVYVSDRMNQRIQVFTPQGRFVGEVAIDKGLKSPVTASGITFSRDRAQRYLFVADWGNGMIVIVDRKALKVIGTIGSLGTEPGQFKGPHLIDTDSKGVIYVAEVQGKRLQRLIPAGAR